MTKTKSLDENTLASMAYQSYLHGRIAGIVPPESPVRAKLAERYAAASREPVEPYCFLYGVRASGCPLESPDELLGSVYRELGMEPVQAVQAVQAVLS